MSQTAAPAHTLIPYTDPPAFITDTELVERAVRLAYPQTNQPLPRWACVKQTFGNGSGVSRELCKRFGLDPDEMMKVPRRRDR